MSLFLIGYRASGKSTVGRILAERLNKPFVDSDEWIVRRAGKSIREIFAEEGESGFRDLETAVIREIAALPEHIVALGGGALNRPENLEAIQASHPQFVYLHCEAGELAKRIHADPATAASRPALSHLGGGIEEIQTLLARREPIWRSVSSVEIDVTRLTPEQVADAVMRQY
jgi:shikimate kinase